METVNGLPKVLLLMEVIPVEKCVVISCIEMKSRVKPLKSPQNANISYRICYTLTSSLTVSEMSFSANSPSKFLALSFAMIV